MNFSFQARIVLFFSLLFTSIQIITLIKIYQTTQDNVIAQLSQNLIYAGKVFDRQLHVHAERIISETAILSSDFGFRSTVSKDDPATIRSALDNLIQRIHAQRSFYISLDKKVLADTGETYENSDFMFPNAIIEAQQRGHSIFFVVIDGDLHVLSTVPVLAPLPIGWIVIATRIDKNFVEHLKKLFPVSLEISLAVMNQDTLHLHASTLGEDIQKQLEKLPRNQLEDTIDKSVLSDYADHRWVTLSHYLPTAVVGQKNLAILQFRLQEALEPYKQLWYSTITLFSLGLIGVLLGGVGVARQVTQPVRLLASAALRIGKGQFDEPVIINQKDELGRLASAFNLMMEGISNREAHIAYQLRHDDRTGLPNRFCFEESLTKCINQGDAFTVVLAGLDRFSEINSTLGHELGDKLIQSVGELLNRHYPEQAALARLSSDSFGLIISAAEDPERIRFQVESLLKILEEPIAIDSTSIDLSIHLGLAQWPKDGSNSKTLLRKADAALYLARRDAYEYVLYNEESDPCQLGALSLMSELRHGLENDQFMLYVQPLLDIKSGNISFVECLIRWQHPEKGFMPPDLFIPLAEQTGQIIKVTEWVLKQAFILCSAWRQQGLTTKLAINMSAKDLLSNRLTEFLEGLLLKYPVTAEDFMLEITESTVMQDAERALTIMQNLRKMGFQLAVDDFGTGYSSMAYLKKLPVNELKIDKAFVLNLANNQEDMLIVRSIVELGHNLGFKVVAEGLENQESLSALQALNCDIAQGYWISRPMPSENFVAWLLSRVK
jgi:diguanylate cyclase (GGDEF)-like protein